MLSSMRSFATTPIFKIILVLLVVALIALAFGSQIYNTNQDADIVIRYGDTKIQRYQLRAQMNVMANQQNQRTPYESRAAFLEGETPKDSVDFFVDQAVLLADARKQGMVITDADIQRAIRLEPRFRTQNGSGEFSPELYERYVDSGLVNLPAFYQRMGQAALISKYADLVGNNIDLPISIDAAIKAFYSEKRQVVFFKLDEASLSLDTPDEAALKAYYDANRERFRWPEYRRLSYVAFDAPSISGRYTVTEEALLAEHEATLALVSEPEKRHLAQVIFESEEAANVFFDNLKDGISWQEATDGQEVLDLGFNEKDELSDAVSEKAFSLEKGQNSEPLNTDFGWLVLYVSEIIPQNIPTLEERRTDLIETLKLRQANDALFDLSQELDFNLGDGLSLEEAAQKHGLNVTVLENVGDSGVIGQDTHTVFTEIPSMKEEAFRLQQGATSLVLNDGKGGYFALRVDKITPERTKSMEEARQDLIRLVKAERREQALDTAAEQAIAALKSGTDFAQVATKNNTEVISSPLETRSMLGREEALFAAATEQVFTQALEEPFSFSHLGERFIAKVVSIIPGSAENVDFTALFAAQNMALSYQTQVQNALVSFMTKEAKPSINARIVAEVAEEVADNLALK